MTDVHALPVPSVHHGWESVDTSIDTETPALLSDEQLTRYCETVAALLTAAGLRVRSSEEDPTSIEVTNPRTGQGAELDIRDDRSAEWILTGGDEVPEGTTALRLAARITELVGAAPH
ncbi:MAG: hypothetical protein M0026_08965 [Nocardiopsaceae bacterium]|nr:hypothetical protein [Nocardiopsaceae bacterium]